ncbi:MAG TPA: chemotaxis protein CheW, partial [Chroococcales cyanobacterium]
LVRVPAKNVKKRIERIGKAMVIRLRGNLLPIVRLRDVFGIPQGTFQHPETKETKGDRRQGIADRRSEKSEEEGLFPRSPEDRRFHSQSAINIVVVTAGDFHYGIIVDNLLDSEEIVVKPLGRHLSECRGYAGATILGDGKVALILDVVGIATLMKLSSVMEESHEKSEKKKGLQDAQSLVIVKNAKSEQFAVPLGLISRIERIDKRDIELTGGQLGVKYRETNLALFSIEDVVRATPREDLDHLYVIVFQVAGREVGILVSQIIDVVDIDLAIDETTFRQSGILGSVIVLGETTLLLDLYDIVAKLKPEWAAQLPVSARAQKSKILLVEDSQFFLNQIKSFLEDAGYFVITAEDGALALEALETQQGEIAMVVTDIEMPNLDGLELTRRIRADQRFKELPVIAVTSVAGESAEKKGLAAGIDDYLIKLDREKILERIGFYLRQPKER